MIALGNNLVTWYNISIDAIGWHNIAAVDI